MKRIWELDELIEHFTILPNEMSLVENKTGETKIGFLGTFFGGDHVKRNWELDELIEHFTFLPNEMQQVGNKSGETRLGFAVLFKFFGYSDFIVESQK
jgi:hypothetical protein